MDSALPEPKVQQITDYELQRAERIARNKRALQELGVDQLNVELRGSAAAGEKPVRAKAPAEALEPTRRSSRARIEKTFGDDFETGENLELRTAAAVAKPRPQFVLDPDQVELLRREAEARRAEAEARRAEAGGSPGRAGSSRGPKDSGKGVRVQGGRVYDSSCGVTCHWCRQKTLEHKVTCSNPACCGGKKLPLSFCGRCLRNRHGEDVAAAEASGCWVCPCCRGSCGKGCVMCCNCGLCRKKLGLEPTHQLLPQARQASFTNVHDYLVHLATGESAEQIAGRKAAAPWGKFLQHQPPAAAAEDEAVAQ